jgi:hypothetical protein
MPPESPEHATASGAVSAINAAEQTIDLHRDAR